MSGCAARPFVKQGIFVGLMTSVQGPPLGAMTFWGLLALHQAASEGLSSFGIDTLQTFAFLMLYSSLIAYAVAGVPALLAGAALGWHTAAHGTFSRTRAAVTAALATIAGTFPARFLLPGEGVREGVIGLVVLFVPLSVVAALLCRALMGRIGLIASR